MTLGVIKNEAGYKKAMEEIENLIVLDPEPGSEEAEKLDLLSVLVEKYESERYTFDLPNPLEAIRFRMEEQNLRQKDLVPFIGGKSKVSEVLSGKRALTVSMIRALHEGLGIPLKVLVQDAPEKIEDSSEIEWEKFPVKEMVKRGWIEASAKEIKSKTQELIESFFKPLGGVGQTPVFCRRTLVERSGKKMDTYALWAWTAQVLIAASEMDLVPYKETTIDEGFLKRVAELSLSSTGPLDAQKHLTEHGIALVIEPHLPKTHLDGAAMIADSGNPVIGLTLRHDRIDNFWYNLIHELVHVWKHLKGTEEAFIDDLDSDSGRNPREREADRITGETLIPRSIWKRSDAFRQRTPDAITQLALQLKIHPSIVAGRIRHDTKNYYILSNMVGTGKVRELFKDVTWK